MSDSNGSYVSNRELDTKLTSMRWEFRALILMAFVAGRFIPAGLEDKVQTGALALLGLVA